MSKSNGWVAIDKMLARELPICGRAYTKLEAMFSYSVDQDNGVAGSIKGYAKLWNWSRNKVRKFLEEIRTPKGHPGDTRGTPKGHPFHFIDTGLREQKDTQRTLEGHPRDTQRTPTNNPNPNPNPKKITTLLSDFLNKNPDAKIYDKSFKNWGTENDEKLARFIHRKLKEKFPKQPEPKFAQWANDIRLMRERDGHTHKEIQNTFLWAHNDDFWSCNILSPGKLRSQFHKISAKMTSAGEISPIYEDLEVEDIKAYERRVAALKAKNNAANDIY